jgi:hypothetical protein
MNEVAKNPAPKEQKKQQTVKLSKGKKITFKYVVSNKISSKQKNMRLIRIKKSILTKAGFEPVNEKLQKILQTIPLH